MKVFISWSGDLSKLVAEALREWLPAVIQAVVPYVSSEDIDKGARWSADISKELSESNYGILCVTRENLLAPWLNFEAGALSKSFDKSNVSPFLFRIDRGDVTGPLLQFQSTIYERSDVLKLVKSINGECEAGLDPALLEQVFDVWWPKLKESLDGLRELPDVSGDLKRSSEDMLLEVLELVRAQQKTLATPEELLPPEYIGYVMRHYNPDMGLMEDIIGSVRILHHILLKADEAEDNSTLSEAKDLCRRLEFMIRELADPRKYRRTNRRPLTRNSIAQVGDAQKA
ncbi:hypothetical protein [Nonomuraea sp. NPDC049646]|uniref:hypothetical protein n=1 Tax=unclassified Nonomuraea TaxID=2593643 RepID=UPI0037B20FA4